PPGGPGGGGEAPPGGKYSARQRISSTYLRRAVLSLALLFAASIPGSRLLGAPETAPAAPAAAPAASAIPSAAASAAPKERGPSLKRGSAREQGSAYMESI